MKKLSLSILVTVIVFTIAYIGGITSRQPRQSQQFGDAITKYQVITTLASSTVYTVTTASQVLLASTTNYTTSYNRVAALIQLAGCTAPGLKVHLNRNNGIAATTATGPALLASTTESILYSTFTNPVTNDAIQGITNAGTCTVIATEYLTPR